MNHYSPLISALVAMLLTLILTLSKHGTIQDISEETALPTGPLPRTGGIALMAGTLAGWVLLFKFWQWWIVLPVMGLFVLSLVDDVRGLTPRMRLIGHLIAALIVVAGAGISWLWILPVLLYVVWMTNLYGVMDGSDGMAAGMGLFGFSFYAIGGLMGGNEAFAMLSFSVGAASLGFLYHNFYPARVFLGSSGLTSLGFLAAAFGVWGWHQGYWPFWFPILVFSPFVVDATLILIGRVRRRENPFAVHNGHYYQRLLQTGISPRNLAIAEYGLMFATGVSALVALGLDAKGQGNLLAWWGAIYLGLSMWIDRRWRGHAAGNDA